MLKREQLNQVLIGLLLRLSLVTVEVRREIKVTLAVEAVEVEVKVLESEQLRKVLIWLLLNLSLVTL